MSTNPLMTTQSLHYHTRQLTLCVLFYQQQATSNIKRTNIATQTEINVNLTTEQTTFAPDTLPNLVCLTCFENKMVH